MNRQEFMYRLAAELSMLPQEETLAAMEYYDEYFDEAGPDREQEAIRELGSPEKIAAQIKGDYAMRQLVEPGMGKSPRKGMRAFLWVILGVFAAPVALPVAIALGVCVLAIFICLFAVVISLVIAFGATCASGIALVGVGIAGLSGSVAGGIMLIGMGLVAAGITAILCVGVAIGGQTVARLLAKRLRKGYDRWQARRLEKEEK